MRVTDAVRAGAVNGTNTKRGRREEEQSDVIIKPEPLKIDNPGNSSSWYSGVTKLLTAAQKWAADIYKKLTKGIFGDPSMDPNELRHQLFQANTIIGMMYGLFDYIVNMQRSNTDANRGTFDLAKPAR